MSRQASDGDAELVHDLENNGAIGNNLVHGAIVAVAEERKNVERHSVATHVQIGHAQGISTALNQNGAIVLACGGQSTAQRRGGEIGLAGSECQAGFVEGNVGLGVGIPLRDRERQSHGGAAAIGDLEALAGGQRARRLENTE